MTDYSWDVETLADCGDGLDTYNLRELSLSVKRESLYIMQQVTKKWDKRIEDDIVENNLCPNCLTELVAKMKVHISNNWDEPGGSWEEPAGEGCPECGWEG